MMKTKTRERIYLLVTVFCVLMCAVLLLSVILGRPAFAALPGEHVPVLRPLEGQDDGGEQLSSAAPPAADPAAAGTELVLSEEELEERLAACLPSSFPKASLDVDVEEDGTLELSAELSRDELRDWLRDSGLTLTLRQSLALRLLPKELSVELTMRAAEQDGAMELTPRSLELDEQEIDLSGLPAGLLSMVSAALNAALEAAGHPFSSIGFTDGGLVLS